MVAVNMSDIGRKSVAQVFREWVQFLTVILVAILGAWQFYFKEVLIPSRRPAVLVIGATLDAIGRRGNMVLLRARIHLVNKSTNRVYLTNLWYTATGIRFDLIDPLNGPEPLEVERDLDGDAWFSAFSTPPLREVVAAWKLPPDTTWYDPTDETSNEQLFYVPANRYDAVQLQVDINVMRSIADLAPEKWTVNPDGSLFPQMFLKRPGWEKDPSLVEELDPVSKHHKWAHANGAGHNSAYATVSLSNAGLSK
jgi:hypothetical protein